jgi:hypothetical protein
MDYLHWYELAYLFTVGAFMLFMASQTQLPPLRGAAWSVIGCVGVCLGPVLYLLYCKASKWRKTVAMETQRGVPGTWQAMQDKSYYIDG